MIRILKDLFPVDFLHDDWINFYHIYWQNIYQEKTLSNEKKAIEWLRCKQNPLYFIYNPTNTIFSIGCSTIISYDTLIDIY